MELTESEDIKKSWQEYTEELYKKDIHDPDNHDGVIIHLEPGILECVPPDKNRKGTESSFFKSAVVEQLCGSLSILWHCLSLGLE